MGRRINHCLNRSHEGLCAGAGQSEGTLCREGRHRAREEPLPTGAICYTAIHETRTPNPIQLRFYKDNTEWQGFAEPYGMNIVTDDRATLLGRMIEFFLLPKRDLAIPSESPLYSIFDGVFLQQKAK